MVFWGGCSRLGCRWVWLFGVGDAMQRGCGSAGGMQWFPVGVAMKGGCGSMGWVWLCRMDVAAWVGAVVQGGLVQQ